MRFTRLAPVYDLFAAPVGARARRLAVTQAGLTGDQAILEVGAGTGLLFARLLRVNTRGFTVGVDRTPAMLRRAARRARRADPARYRLCAGDARALAFADASFDVVFAAYVVDLLPSADLARALGELRRVLRPGGRLVLVNTTGGPRWYHRAWARLADRWPALLGGSRSVAMAPVLGNAGFVDVRRRFVSRWTFPSEVVVGTKPLPR